MFNRYCCRYPWRCENVCRCGYRSAMGFWFTVQKHLWKSKFNILSIVLFLNNLINQWIKYLKNSFSDKICFELYCRENYTAICDALLYEAAADGTLCASGSVIISIFILEKLKINKFNIELLSRTMPAKCKSTYWYLLIWWRCYYFLWNFNELQDLH